MIFYVDRQTFKIYLKLRVNIFLHTITSWFSIHFGKKNIHEKRKNSHSFLWEFFSCFLFMILRFKLVKTASASAAFSHTNPLWIILRGKLKFISIGEILPFEVKMNNTEFLADTQGIPKICASCTVSECFLIE